MSDAVLAGAWVIDLRDSAAYADGHLPGSVSLENPPQFATYAGWLVPWDDDIVLLTDSAEVLEPALRDLARIGIDGVGAHVLTHDDALTASYRHSDWDGFREALRVSWSTYARSTSLTTATRRAPSTCRCRTSSRPRPPCPEAKKWVHCKSGYRAGIAASLLHRMGHAVVHVDDSWDRVSELAISTSAAAA